MNTVLISSLYRKIKLINVPIGQEIYEVAKSQQCHKIFKICNALKTTFEGICIACIIAVIMHNLFIFSTLLLHIVIIQCFASKISLITCQYNEMFIRKLIILSWFTVQFYFSMCVFLFILNAHLRFSAARVIAPYLTKFYVRWNIIKQARPQSYIHLKQRKATFPNKSFAAFAGKMLSPP